MNFMPTEWTVRHFIVTIILLQLMVYFSVFFNIPIFRQVLCFFYFTFLPGFVFLKLLNLKEFDWVETLLFSVGFSVAFLMLVGLLVNQLFLLLDISQPLSVLPLLLIFSNLVLIGGVLVYFRSGDVVTWKSKPFNQSPFTLLFLCLPILSIVGAMCVNVYGNNLLLLFMIPAISLLFIISVTCKKLVPPKLYPIAVFMLTIALLYHSSLISNYIVPFSSDIPGEYYVFKTTESNAHWSSTPPSFFGMGAGRINSMLSVTILPTVYSILLNMDSTWMFKILFPLLFAFVPLGLYKIWQNYISKKYAFISAFLFVALFTFYTEMLGLARQMIAELFFVLLLLTILNQKIKPVNKTLCFMIFSVALITSHYAVAEIFLTLIAFALVSLYILKRPSRNITVSMVVFFFVVMFAWYIYTSNSATFNSFLEFGENIYQQLGDFFNPASRGQTVMTGLGLAGSPSLWNTISRVFAYLTQGLIVLGFIALVTKRLKRRIEKEYFIISIAAMVCLVMLILVPGLASAFNMTRFYHVLLFFLAPFCVIGAVFLTKLLFKREKARVISVLLIVVLVPYFLFQSGFVYEVTKSDSWSIPLSGYRMDALRLYSHSGYTTAYSVHGAQWLSQHFDATNSQLYADESSRYYVLTIYGMVYGGFVNRLSNTTTVKNNGAVYLNTLNVVDGVVPFAEFSWNTRDLSNIFDDLNMIYINGGCEVYQNKP